MNNVVRELESQIDSFEIEIGGLSVKKGKTRPPRLTHLETSITRHKSSYNEVRIELCQKHVNDVKNFLDDYVECKQVLFYKILFCFFITSSHFWGVKGICHYSYKKSITYMLFVGHLCEFSLLHIFLRGL